MTSWQDSIVPPVYDLESMARMMRAAHASHATWSPDGSLTSLTLDPLPPPPDETRSVTTQQSLPTREEEERRRADQRRVALGASGGVRLRPEYDR